jgi:hypothetical protein
VVQPFFFEGALGKDFGLEIFARFGCKLIQAWWSGCFAGLFGDFVVQRDGKSWTSCGELRGKRGWETTPFKGLKNRTRF